jgi:hypothetical protein
MTLLISSDPDDRPSGSIKSRRRDTVILAVVGFAAAVLLFASAALPVLSDRAPDDASATTAAPRTTVRSPPPASAVLQIQSPSPSPPSLPPTTVDVATSAPSTTAVPSTSPPTSRASTPSTAPPRTDHIGGQVRSLSVGPIDLSAFPLVAFDVVVPERLAAVHIRPTMVDVDGAPVDSVTAVDPRDIAVALVIDDGPTVDAKVLGNLQGASVELVRNLGRGTEIALATPSGLASAFTSSPDANIGRIAAITAGSPAVTPLPGLLTSSIRELASNPARDRQAVLMLGHELDPSPGQLAALEQAIATSGTRLHLIVARGVDATALASIAETSGGLVASASNVLASIDEVTTAIARRYRVVATMTSRGEHSIALTAKELRYEVTVRIA